MTDGARTRDNRNHNPGLYQLSYGHRYRRRGDLRSRAEFAKRKMMFSAHEFHQAAIVDDEAHRIPITPELDLHTFRPSEIGELLPEYFDECLREGIQSVRVIHGKGTGNLREGVHSLLRRLPQVVDFQYPAGAGSGSWGATWVRLRGPESTADPRVD